MNNEKGHPAKRRNFSALIAPPAGAADYMAVGGVRREPVSGPPSLFGREDTGNSPNLARSFAASRAETGVIPALSGAVPCSQEQGTTGPGTGNLSAQTGNREPPVVSRSRRRSVDFRHDPGGRAHTRGLEDSCATRSSHDEPQRRASVSPYPAFRDAGHRALPRRTISKPLRP